MLLEEASRGVPGANVISDSANVVIRACAVEKPVDDCGQ
jgi:hypothetical protein